MNIREIENFTMKNISLGIQVYEWFVLSFILRRNNQTVTITTDGGKYFESVRRIWLHFLFNLENDGLMYRANKQVVIMSSYCYFIDSQLYLFNFLQQML